MHLSNIIKEMEIDPRSLPVRIALVGAEPYTEETRRRLEAIYDMCSPGCTVRQTSRRTSRRSRETEA